MNGRTVDWAALRARGAGATEETGLRERKKRLTRQQLTDTATELFLERGFDAVRVAEIAEACGVSEKTVFNYFPTKESLVMDQPDATLAALRTDLADPETAPLDAALRILSDELGALTDWLTAQDDLADAVARTRRFSALIHSTPALRAYERESADRLVAAAAEALAHRFGGSPDDPEPAVAAAALLGLWPVQYRALHRHLDSTRTPAQIRDAVTCEVARAARLLDSGLGTLGGRAAPRTTTPGTTAPQATTPGTTQHRTAP